MILPTKKLLKNSNQTVKHPIYRVVSQRLIFFLAIISLIISAGSYLQSMASTEIQIREMLMNNIEERGLRESLLFLESDAYQARFQQEYIERFLRMGDQDPTEWFDTHLEKHPDDGTYRSIPELYYGIDKDLGRQDISASMMIGAETIITPDVRKALAIGYDMINQYGPAWRSPFVDLYFSSPEKTSVSRWPGTPWGLMMDDNVDWRLEEWFAITTIELNPLREQRWSGVLFDERNGNWMVSGVTPLDIDGKQVGMVGTDLLLDDLVERTINISMPGTYNILLQTDGRVIVHPDKIDEIIESKGQLFAQTSSDNHLKRIYEKALITTDLPTVIENSADNEFLAITQIEGPDWFFITIYPKSLMQEIALQNVGVTILTAALFLIAMIFIIRWVLKENLVNPLEYLTKIIIDFELGSGHWLERVNDFIKKTNKYKYNPDEIGLLASSFEGMGNRLKKVYSDLDASKERFKSISQTASDSIITIDEFGKIIFINKATEVMFETPQEKLIGQDLKLIMPERYWIEHQDRLNKLGSGIEPKILSKTVKLHGLRKGTIEFPIELSISNWEVKGVKYYSAIIRDITVREEALLKLNRQLLESTTIHEISNAALTMNNIDHLIEKVTTIIGKNFYPDHFGILLYDFDKEQLSPHKSYVGLTAEDRIFTAPLGKGIIGTVAKNIKSIRISDTRNNSIYLATDSGVFLSEICVPIQFEGKLLGVINAESKNVNSFDVFDERLLTTVANQTALAINRISIMNDIKNLNQDLSISYQATLEGWSRAMDLRDRNTEDHSKRVTNLTVSLAKRIKYPESEIDFLKRGALLHDIGKIGIPDDVLLKPGPLNEEEWELMKTHPLLANDLLKNIPFLDKSLAIPLYHHENWDGTGYPNGLKGDEIPLAARIFSIIDVYDALGSDRPYRTAWKKDKVLAYLIEQSGKKFDPYLLNEFILLIK